MFKDYTLYSRKPFINSNQIRRIIGDHLYDTVLNNIDVLNSRVDNVEDITEVLVEMTSDEQFHL